MRNGAKQWGLAAVLTGLTSAALFGHVFPGDAGVARQNAAGCLTAAVSTSAMVMAYYPALRSGKVRALRITCAAAVGAATFLNLAWCLWALGAPIDIGAVRRGQLHGQYWVGPFAMAYAVFCWARFRKAAAEGKDG